MDTRHGLTVCVYRSAHADASLKGITSRETTLLLIDDKLDGIYQPEPDTVYLTLVRRKIRPNEPEYIHAVPTINGCSNLAECLAATLYILRIPAFQPSTDTLFPCMIVLNTKN
jgi:hypothetical protein